MNKVSNIQIPNVLVRNNEINALEFVLILNLKYLSFLKGSDKFEIDLRKLKCKIGVEDTRTIKKCLIRLYEFGILKEEVVLYKKKPIRIWINEMILNNKPFTQLPAILNGYIDKIEPVGIRLLYYYESYINRSDVLKQYCYPSMETTQKELGISRNTVIKYNEILVKNGLLKIEKHKLETEYQYDDEDNLLFDKYNNHYYVRIENIKSKNEN